MAYERSGSQNPRRAAPRVLRVEQGGSYFLDNDDELPYTLIRNLGHGSCANVEAVRDSFTGAIFARKVIKIHGARAEMTRIFENELRNIQRLAKHHHIIEVFASYIGRREVGLIMSPVASHGSLDLLLQDVLEDSGQESDFRLLHKSFGCLASGLQFMHTQGVRHKDIKPHNILVHGDTLIYTDFGSSLDYNAAGKSVTTGPSHSGTRRYTAPEAYEGSPRSSKTDVFSLGCVFVEILIALTLCAFPHDVRPYREHIDTIVSVLKENTHIVDAWLAAVFVETSMMLAHEMSLRPSAESLTAALRNVNPGNFCLECQKTYSIGSVSLPTLQPDLESGSQAPHHSRHTLASIALNPNDTLSRTSMHDQIVLQPIGESTSFLKDHSMATSGENYPDDYFRDYTVSLDSNFPFITTPFRPQTRKQDPMYPFDVTRRSLKPYRCSVPDCKSRDRGFTTINDLHSHWESVHRAILPGSYKCASVNCKNPHKVWLRLDSFKKHIERMHKGEDFNDLISRSEVKPMLPTP
ncbi:kinase-like protein [Plenodomus tracheiphilus IPT5]|uniref:mitogen-activated protein kinase kinase n=1 Tax=Plenodomus tracheiphilus IPT5 TaxID=1408161 RepID=A0A6A7B502_9PLEO|nr:kinase-like protein [Plenodomus tracheiphilus IPT5]